MLFISVVIVSSFKRTICVCLCYLHRNLLTLRAAALFGRAYKINPMSGIHIFLLLLFSSICDSGCRPWCTLPYFSLLSIRFPLLSPVYPTLADEYFFSQRLLAFFFAPFFLVCGCSIRCYLQHRRDTFQEWVEQKKKKKKNYEVGYIRRQARVTSEQVNNRMNGAKYFAVMCVCSCRN